MNESLLYIGGVWRRGSAGHCVPVYNPATESVAGRVAHASAGDVHAAVDAAHGALGAWSRTSPGSRGEVLRRAAAVLAARVDAIAAGLTVEQGKTLPEARAELGRAIETLSWHADAAPLVCAARTTGDASILPEPIGVVGAFTPWNYPAVIIARKVGAALAAGCPVVLKAAEETPATAAAIVSALEEAGLPPGVVNLLFGDPPAISAQLLDEPRLRAFSFTGSTAVGRELAQRAGRTLKRCVLELGGHSPVLVFTDADVEAAVRAITAYKFECAGQSCNAPSRIYVQEAIHDRFVEAFADAARRIRVGDGLDPSSDMGPMAHPRRLAVMARLTEEARQRGARIIVGGRRLDRRGWFWAPTVLTEVPPDAALLSEEPFGPIAPILPFSTPEEGIRRANENPYGLAAYAFTQSTDTAHAAARALAAGSVGINELRGVPPDVGIAGIKDSGHGYEGGQAGVEAFLNLKVVRGGVPSGGR